MYMIVFIVAVVFNEYLSALKECLIHIRVRWGGGYSSLGYSGDRDFHMWELDSLYISQRWINL